MPATNNRIWVTFQRKGVHAYPAAPSDVNYLAHPHRHLFKFKVTISVTHEDREIEYHQFQSWLESLYADAVLAVDAKSCEMLANELAVLVCGRYPHRTVEVEVSEDGECGSIVTYVDGSL